MNISLDDFISFKPNKIFEMEQGSETTSSSLSSAATSSNQQPPSTSSPPELNLKQPQVPGFTGFLGFGNGDVDVPPVMYPAVVGGLNPWENQQQMNYRAGIYAVPVLPCTGIFSNTLIPLTYNIPATRASTEGGLAGTEHGQGEQDQQNQHQQPARQRRVVRRFQIAFQLDLLLILKLAAVIFLFNQDGSKLRLIVLVLFASLIYLYQTGALTPLFRWLSESMHRAAQPPRPPRPPVRAENAPGAARQGNENAALAEGQAGAVDQNQPLNGEAENENVGGNQWWGIVKEIQMIVFGFITSLLPGVHNID